MKILGLIPARGGSKGIPKKNIIDLGGRPLISYTIDAALFSEKIDKVVVSSDDDKILSISKKCGAQTINRPDELSGDKTPIDKVISHSLDALEKIENFVPDLVVLLQPTSPLRTSQTINLAVELFVSKIDQYDSLIPLHKLVSKVGEVRDGMYVPLWHKPGLQRQELNSLYIECGTIFIFKPDLIRAGKFHGERILPFIVDNVEETLDIDTYNDLKLANCYLKKNDTR